jgi:iron complex transport system ATP-binding protein
MDVGYQISTLALARELSRQGHTVVLALHDLNLASGFADEAVLLHAGRTAAEGAIEMVLNSQEIERVYGAQFDRLLDEKSGRTVLFPEIVPDRNRSARQFKIHFIGGGGSAGALMNEAWQLGHKVSLGVVAESDSDALAARRLGVPTVFATSKAITKSDVASSVEMISDSDVVIVTAAPYDQSNLLNLALAYTAQQNGIEVWIEAQAGHWDFTGNEATQAIELLEKGGARILDSGEIRTLLAGPR